MATKAPIILKAKLVWIGLLLFVAVWMFVLGIMVGRGTAPIAQVNQSIEQTLAQLKASQSDKTRTNPQSPAEQRQDIPVTELKFYEKLKETKPIQKPRPVSPKPSLKKAPPKPKPVPDAQQPVKTSPSPSASAKKPPKPQSDTDKVAQSSQPPAKERFTIQVAAVKSSINAEKLVLDLRRQGYDAYQIRSQSQDGKTWYRVRVGAFQSRSEAQSTLTRLSKIKINGMVLQTQ